MAQTADIPFCRLPHQSELFLRYLDHSPAALRFYQAAPAMNSLVETARSRIANPEFPRKELASLLCRQNESFGAGRAAMSQIAELEERDCVAVLTGQQAGLFGGPLYTIYKAATAVNLAGRLKARGVRAIPIFWMDTEDHDLAEVSRSTVLDGARPLARDYRKILFGNRIPSAASIGSIAFEETVRVAVEDYLGYLPDSVWSLQVRIPVQEAYKPGVSFARAFAALLSRTFNGAGLIFFDPRDPEAKRLSSAMFQKALREAKTIRSALALRNQELESAGFHAQVKLRENSTTLFMISDGRRRALEMRGEGFGLKGSDHIFSMEELLARAVQRPEEFSPNVLLRPLVQDLLFPTAAYVAGSSELAYFAQIETIYRLTGLSMPVIWPRNGFTLIGPEIGKTMDRLGIAAEDCFKERQLLIDLAVRGPGFSKALGHVEDLQKNLERCMADLQPELQAFEPPLAQSAETAGKKIAHNVQLLKNRLLRMETTRNASLVEEIDWMLNSCRPNGNLQEREFGIHPFLARYGFSLLDAILEAADPENFNHQAILLGK